MVAKLRLVLASPLSQLGLRAIPLRCLTTSHTNRSLLAPPHSSRNSVTFVAEADFPQRSYQMNHERMPDRHVVTRLFRTLNQPCTVVCTFPVDRCIQSYCPDDVVMMS